MAERTTQKRKKYPDLRFELVNTFLYLSSVTVLYSGAERKLVAKVMSLGAGHQVERVYAHYLCSPSGESGH